VRWATLLLLLLVYATPLQADNYGVSDEDESISEGVRIARGLMAKGDWAGAVPLLEAHLSGFYDDDETMADLGYAYWHIGEKELAVATLQSALWINPRNLEANLYLGEVSLDIGNPAEAQHRLEILDGICFFGCAEYWTLKRLLGQTTRPK
jgi:tetratricopeptide (TPR) repeat protein